MTDYLRQVKGRFGYSAFDNFWKILGDVPLFPEGPVPSGCSALYTLRDPRVTVSPSNQIRYVGQTVNYGERYYAHIIQLHYRSHKVHWIKQLIGHGYLPVMRLIMHVPLDEVDGKEMSAIRFWGKYYNLTNARTGGDGQTPGFKFDLIARQKLSKAGLGTRCEDPEGRRFRSVSKIKKHTLESRAKIVAANRGEANHQAKLTWDIVRDIRRRLADGEVGIDVAREYGIGSTQLSRIRRNFSWKESS